MTKKAIVALFSLLLVLGVIVSVGAEDAIVNVGLGATYTMEPTPSDNYPDPGLSKVTDGSYAFSWGDVIGWADGLQKPVITIDLGKAVENITGVTGRFMRSAGSAVNMPLAMNIRASVDGMTFTPIGTTRAMYPDPPTNERINQMYFELREGFTAQYIQVEIEPGAGWLMLAEIEVLTGEQPEYFEVARGKTYTVTPALHANYDDAEGTALTDGDSSFAWSSMIGWEAPEENPIIILDLGDFIENIDHIGISFMRSDQSLVSLPEQVKLSMSNDGSRWFPVGNAVFTSPDPTTNEQVNTLYWLAKTPFDREVGQYVRFEIVPSGTAWTLVNEITVGVHRVKQGDVK